MKAVVTVIGKDSVGIIAKVSAFLSANNINIEDISQTVMQDYFAMIMMVDISASKIPLEKLSSLCEREGRKIGMVIRIMHEDIFNAMHKI